MPTWTDGTDAVKIALKWVNSGKQATDMKVFFSKLVTLVMICSVSMPAAVAALRYDVTYRGVLSAMQTLDIADAVLSTEPATEVGLQRSELQISSAGHSAVESVYPFRYRVRSLYRKNGEGAVAFELYKQTRRTRQEIFLIDPANGKLVAYRRSGVGPELPATIATQLGVEQRHRQRGEGMEVAVEQLFDRLSLLQHLGSLPMAIGRDFQLRATDGDETFTYRIQVDKREPQRAAGRTWDTWRLRLDAKDQDGKPAHRPVYLWLADQPDRMLVRAEAKHPAGRFLISLADTNAPEMRADKMRWKAVPSADFLVTSAESG